jgi:hypothetical protein
MSSILSTLRRDYKQSQCERGTIIERPPISFIPDEGLMDATKSHELLVRVSEDVATNTIRIKVPILGLATAEEYIGWEIDLRNVIRRKPCASAMSKFDMTDMLTAGNSQARWREIVREVTETRPAIIDGAAGARGIAPGHTNETFESCLSRFKGHFFPKSAIRAQKIYLRNHVKKPGHMPSRVCEQRLREINGYLASFPGSTTNSPMHDDELADIYTRMAPRKFQEQLLLSRAPDNLSLQQVAEYFEQLETTTIVEQSKASQGKAPAEPRGEQPSTRKGSSNRKRHKRSASNGKPSGKPEAATRSASGKWCTLCADHGGRPETHQTADCKRWTVNPTGSGHGGSAEKRSNSGSIGKRGKGKKGTDELHALQAQVNKLMHSQQKLTKALSKKRKRGADLSDDSESE